MSEQPESPRIGVDEWVASAEERRARTRMGRAQEWYDRVPPVFKLVAIALPFAVYPFVVESDYHMQVGIDVLVFVVLALGLNVVVGWVGLLDLGYVAFFGLGAYLYAGVASEYAGRYWEAQYAIPLIVLTAAVAGALLGLPSRRVSGDYLAIVTLFFLQIWLVVTINASFTRGPNGISDLLPLDFLGRQVTSLQGYFFVALVAFVLVISFLYLVNESRTGRAWRALREDELAAQLMTMPVNRLKLMAFATGAGIAGLAGAIFAPIQGAVFPTNFSIILLITVYAMVVLGGPGSLLGVTVGAVLIYVSLEALTSPENASTLFYTVIVGAVVVLMRPWWRSAVVLAGTAAFGFLAHEAAERWKPSYVAGTPLGQARVDELVDGWVLLPTGVISEDGLPIGSTARIAYLALVAAILALTLVRSTLWRSVGLVPVLYLTACVWENLMLAQPAVARFILIGAMLVALMAVRPQGLLGRQRMEIV